MTIIYHSGGMKRCPCAWHHQLLPELGIFTINWHFQPGCFQGINFLQEWWKIWGWVLLLFFCWVLGYFCCLDSKVKCHWWVRYGPTLLLSAGHPSPFTDTILSPHQIYSFSSPSLPPMSASLNAENNTKWDLPSEILSQQKNQLLSHAGKHWSPQWLRNIGGEGGKITFSSCLFSMEKLIPLNGHFLVLSHSEKLLLWFFFFSPEIFTFTLCEVTPRCPPQPHDQHTGPNSQNKPLSPFLHRISLPVPGFIDIIMGSPHKLQPRGQLTAQTTADIWEVAKLGLENDLGFPPVKGSRSVTVY